MSCPILLYGHKSQERRQGFETVQNQLKGKEVTPQALEKEKICRCLSIDWVNFRVVLMASRFMERSQLSF